MCHTRKCTLVGSGKQHGAVNMVMLYIFYLCEGRSSRPICKLLMLEQLKLNHVPLKTQITMIHAPVQFSR